MLRHHHVPSGLLLGLTRWTLVCGALGLSGCAFMGPTQTGFLHDYQNLSPTTDRLNWGAGLHSVQVQLPSPSDLAGIDSFLIEPISWLDPGKDWLGDNADRKTRVEAALDTALREKLGAIRPIVATAGPRTARVRAAVTTVKSSRPMINALATVVWGPITNGGASVEAEVLAPDGHPIAAVDGGSSGGFIDIWGFYTRSGHPKTAAYRLAGELRDTLRAADHQP